MINDLVSPDELDGFPGSPFSDVEVTSAVTALREVLGWHVAPRKQTQHVFDFDGTNWRLLPTQQLVSVDEVTCEGEAVGHHASRSRPHRLTIETRVDRPREVDVTMTHGFDECPSDLLPIIAEHCRSSRGATGGVVKSRSAIEYSETYDTTGAVAADALGSSATVQRYSVLQLGFA